ncbi:Cu2+-exporting ATPase [Weissella uvarum]|uniref:hypothetical protein n=1 Tax=Weissella uvarum TaxID=1479233 RepID=UPI0019614A88|nr:hypothetical protein [Weissella uvarum]MBM7617949.1 Cu2+-exporting ATPase [Weissella uvarum]MCM0596168.1 hypothetical protein [Weissella uvarum]
MRQIHYRWLAAVAFILAIISGLFMPILWGWDVAIALAQANLILYLLAAAGVYIIVADGLIGWLAWRHQRAAGHSSLWIPLLGQTTWFILTIWCYIMPMHADSLKTVTLPITMLGIGLLMLTMNWAQTAEHKAPASAAMVRSTRRLSWLSVLFASYGFIFFGMMWDWQIALAVATASLLIIDPRWPLIFAARKRAQAIEQLEETRVKVHHPAALDRVGQLQDVVMEKTGVLTSRHVTVYNVDSLDDDYSDQDILAIMAGLEQEAWGLYAEALLSYSHQNGVYPIQAQDLETIPSVGVRGTINEETYELVSASYALHHHYEYNRQWLKDLIALGNSVSLLVCQGKAVGVVSFGAPLIRSLMETDEFFAKQKLTVNIASADTKGSLMRVQETMQSLGEVHGGLAVDDKETLQQDWANNKSTMFITNQAYPEDYTADVIVSFIDDSPQTDLVIGKLGDIQQIFQTSKKLRQIDHRTLWIWQVILLIFILLAAGLEVFINLSNSLLLFVPILAVFVRTVLTMLTHYIVKFNQA